MRVGRGAEKRAGRGLACLGRSGKVVEKLLITLVLFLVLSAVWALIAYFAHAFRSTRRLQVEKIRGERGGYEGMKR